MRSIRFAANPKGAALMTQVPNYGTAYYDAQTNPRPTSVTVVAIVGIVWGALMLLCNGFGLISLFMPTFGAPNPAIDAIRADRVANRVVDRRADLRAGAVGPAARRQHRRAETASLGSQRRC